MSWFWCGQRLLNDPGYDWRGWLAAQWEALTLPPASVVSEPESVPCWLRLPNPRVGLPRDSPTGQRQWGAPGLSRGDVAGAVPGPPGPCAGRLLPPRPAAAGRAAAAPETRLQLQAMRQLLHALFA